MAADSQNQDNPYRHLVHLGVELGGERDRSRLYDRIVEAAINIAGADAGALYTWNDDGQLVPVSIAHRAAGLVPDSPETDALLERMQAACPEIYASTLNRADWLAAVVARERDTLDLPLETGGPVSCDDLLMLSGDNRPLSGTVLAVPMNHGGHRVAGVLAVIRRDGEEFDARTRDLLDLMSDQAAGHLENLELRNQSIRTGVLLMSERDPEKLLERILERAKALSNAGAAVLFTRDDQNRLKYSTVLVRSEGIRLGAWRGASELAPPLPLEGDAAAVKSCAVQAALQQKVINVADFKGSFPEGTPVSRFLMARFDCEVETALIVPLVDRKQRTVGVLYLVNAEDGHSGQPVHFGSHMARMVDSMASQAVEAVDNQAVYRQLVNTGISLSAELDHDRLLEKILLEAKEICNADGGTLYLMSDDEKELVFSIVHNDSLKMAQGGKTGEPITLKPLKLYDEYGVANHNAVASHVALTGEPVNIEDAYQAQDYDFSGARRFDQQSGYRSKSFLTVPLKDRSNRVIGVLQLINARDWKNHTVIPFSGQIQPLVESLASQAAVALNNQQLLLAQKRLLDDFIDLIARAIDAKSPYTGKHCQRVPMLTMMLTEAACRSERPAFKEFDLSETELYELHVAAMLHDCGKVTTPEYVVDKATKLETIYNRIHEIRTRFEVCKRDAEIAYLKAVAEPDADRDALKADLDRTLAQLDDDFYFLADCNIGGEFMSDDKIERLHRIAKMTWTRTLRDRVGLSQDEELRWTGTPEIAPPAIENLISDQPCHITHWGNDHPGKAMREFGMTVPVPEVKYNSGELYNLTIRRGTLTDEERFKINEHIIQTIIMLKSLPFPRHLARVPEYAGGHHEKMDGTGYPLGLKRDEMSLPARVMAIADIFEALTATDRPYKKGKTLSEAIRIMSFMVKESHIDPDLFRLFLESGVYKEYGQTYLDPDTQVDEVDINSYLNAAE